MNRRRPGPAVAILSVLALSAACGSDDEADPDQPSRSSASKDCVGVPGDVHLLQGPANNVGTRTRLGITGIQLDDDPPTAGIMVIDGEPAGAEVTVSVGDVVTFSSQDYTVSQICASSVDLSEGRPQE